MCVYTSYSGHQTKHTAAFSTQYVQRMVNGHSTSLETEPLSIHDLLLVDILDVEYYRDLEMWVRSHSRSLKLVPFESLGALSYSPYIVTMALSVAICKIFSVKECRDLENQVRGRSRLLKMAPFDRPYATFYWSAIVNIALSCTIFEFFDIE